MKREYSETFECLAERICSNCISSDDDLCSCFDSHTCPYWGEMEDLHSLCVKVDSLYNSILDTASIRDANEVYRDSYLAFLGD